MSNLKLPAPPKDIIAKIDTRLDTQLSSISKEYRKVEINKDEMQKNVHVQHKATCNTKIINENNEIQKYMKTYNLQKAKAALAEKTSDLTDDNEKNRNKKKDFYDNENLSSPYNTSSEDEMSNLKLLAPPKDIMAKTDTRLGMQLSSISKEYRKVEVNKDETQKNVHVQHKATCNAKIINENNEIQKHMKTYPPKNKLSHLHKEPLNITANFSHRSNSDDNFKDQVLRQLHTINLRVIQMSQDINALTANICAKEERGLLIEPENSILDKFSFPLKTELELHELEEYLLDKEHANEFVKELIKIGGTSYKSMTKRVLQKLLCDNIAQTYSWIGFKGKKKFSVLCITSSILTAVQKAHKASSLSDIEAVIKSWLVKAKDRQSKKAKERD